jgi:hypothetical protein
MTSQPIGMAPSGPAQHSTVADTVLLDPIAQYDTAVAYV